MSNITSDRQIKHEINLQIVSKTVAFVLLLMALFSLWGSRLSTAQDVATPVPMACSQVLPLVEKNITDQCGNLDRNQICYANNTVNVSYAENVDPSTTSFSKVGDVIPVDILKSIDTAPLNLTTGEFGIAVLKMQANVPNTTLGQAVTFVLYGDTSLKEQPAGNQQPAAIQPTPSPTCDATTDRLTTMRSAADPNSDQLYMLPPGTAFSATGRNEDGSWVFGNYQGTDGWVYVGENSVTLSCDVSALPLHAAEGNTGNVALASSPAQLPGSGSFYFSTGIAAQASCNDVPVGGMAIQTPAGTKVSFRLNGIDITLGSTMWTQVIKGNRLKIALLEGLSTIGVGNQVRTLHPGEEIIIPLKNATTDHPEASGPPSKPQPSSINDKNLWCAFTQAAGLLNICPALLSTPTPTRRPAGQTQPKPVASTTPIPPSSGSASGGAGSTTGGSGSTTSGATGGSGSTTGGSTGAGGTGGTGPVVSTRPPIIIIRRTPTATLAIPR
jgi:uncharacterized membrane protein YgcG